MKNARNPPMAAVRVGTAGWSLPLVEQPRFPGAGTHLERYARVLPAAEINSTFHRPHRPGTFERWAASVPGDFRFSVKVPRTITHEARLSDCTALVDAFVEGLAPLGEKVGCLLVQLPPKLEFDPKTANGFFDHLRKRFAGAVALEPRHASWFARPVDRLLASLEVTRVVADPLRVTEGAEPGGWTGMAYFRLHGSPRVYYSSYEEDYLEQLAGRLEALRRARIPAWCIFDNTTLGAGTGNALSVLAALRKNKRPAD